MGDMNWWGRDGIAHHIPVLSTMKAACGRTFTHRGADFTRLTQDTGEPWPHCEKCEAALTKKSAKISCPTKGAGSK